MTCSPKEACSAPIPAFKPICINVSCIVTSKSLPLAVAAAVMIALTCSSFWALIVASKSSFCFLAASRTSLSVDCAVTPKAARPKAKINAAFMLLSEFWFCVVSSRSAAYLSKKLPSSSWFAGGAVTVEIMSGSMISSIKPSAFASVALNQWFSPFSHLAASFSVFPVLSAYALVKFFSIERITFACFS
ncbi:hypothetical protein D3C71_1575060 [compost metagenome]